MTSTARRDGIAPKPTDTFIAVMGQTGAGKSTFISHCTSTTVAIGHEMDSCTQEVCPYLCRPLFPSRTWLVDTPGFDDSSRSEVEILEEIATWLAREYKQQAKLRGIIYLHAINVNRMTGSAKRNLHMFKELCGQDAFSHIVLASTMWEEVSQSAGTKRETQLKENSDVWGHMIASGSKLMRHANTSSSAMTIVRRALEASSKEDEVALDIQKQIIDQGRSLQDTQAGKAVQSQLAEERKKMKVEMKALLKKDKMAMAEHVRKLEEDMARNLDRQDRLRRSEMKGLIADLSHQHELAMEKLQRTSNQTIEELKRERAQEQAASEKRINEVRVSSEKRIAETRREARREDRKKREQEVATLEKRLKAIEVSSGKKLDENRKEIDDLWKQIANKTTTKPNDKSATTQPSQVLVPASKIPTAPIDPSIANSSSLLPFLRELGDSSTRSRPFSQEEPIEQPIEQPFDSLYYHPNFYLDLEAERTQRRICVRFPYTAIGLMERAMTNAVRALSMSAVRKLIASRTAPAKGAAHELEAHLVAHLVAQY